MYRKSHSPVKPRVRFLQLGKKSSKIFLTVQKDLLPRLRGQFQTDKITKVRFITLQKILGYRFRKKNLLALALTHSTFAYEWQQENLSDNQRLEFLGDSILGMVIAEELYREYPDASEGKLTQKRSSLVNRNYLADKAKKMSLSEYLLLGKGETKMEGGKNITNLAGVLEAIIGAIYLDGGFEKAKKFIVQKIKE